MLSRRRFTELLAAVGVAAPALPASALPCPPLPRGGAPFQAGQDARPIAARKPISAYAPAEIAELRKAYAAMRALPGKDPRSWIAQADLHASYCMQCDDGAAQVHGSWRFLPWHRAFLYYHERILGSLVGNSDGFRLPCWEWEVERSFPQAYAVPANVGNALWDGKRNAFLSSGAALPVSDATANRVALLCGLTDFLTFGGAASIGGAMELDPHNVMHVDIGMQEPPWRDMGNLGYSARDPLFFAHHANIDKIWHYWNAAGGKNPSEGAFLAMRWSFYDERARRVSISVADLLDHAHRLRYTYRTPDSSTRVAPLRAIYDCRLLCCARGGGVVLEAGREVRARVLAAVEQGGKVALVLPRLDIPDAFAGSFDVIAYGGGRQVPLGALVFTDDGTAMQKNRRTALVLDATLACEALLSAKNPARIYAIARYGGDGFPLSTQAAQLRTGIAV